MADNARGIHVSPGIYTREIDMTYAVRSLGITTLGVVGETLKGPAFQPMDIANWREFQEMFGGTSTEKFKGSKYPKYELPYIAKSYLTESEQLKVVRVLGLSGYNAGPAWIVTASDGNSSTTEASQAVVVIRSRGSYRSWISGSTSACTCESSKYDTLKYYVGEIAPDSGSSACTKIAYNLSALQIKPYIPIDDSGNECIGYNMQGGDGSWAVSQTNRGRFKLVGVVGQYSINETKNIITSGYSGTVQQKQAASEKGYFEYPVSLNPYDKDYILKVLGTTAYNGDSPIFVESLYDVALEQGIANGVISVIDSGDTVDISNATSTSNAGLKGVQAYFTADFCHHKPVDGIVEKPQQALIRKNVGARYLAGEAALDDGITCTPYDFSTNNPTLVKDEYLKGTSASTDVVCNDAIVKIDYNWRGTGSESGKTKTTTKYLYWKDRPATTAATPTVTNYELVSSATSWSWTSNAFDPLQEKMKVGQIYTVKQYTTQDGKRNYLYSYYTKKSVSAATSGASGSSEIDTVNYYGNLLSGGTSGNTDNTSTLVLNKADGQYYKIEPKTEGEKTVSRLAYVTLDMNDYKSAYRYASTPWIVSNLKGDLNRVEVNKLFRFHTISDGDNANYEVKVSIENIRPDEGVFDVVVRRIDDLDESIIPLEKFGRCSMVPGDSNYIAFKIGSFDGVYESKSKFITVEVNDTLPARNSVPAGFLGYPIPLYNGTPISGNSYSGITFPTIMYNRYYDEDIKNRKQYFGLSSWVGVDIDNFTFKGNKTYINRPEFISHGFHLDSRLDYTNGGVSSGSVTVDGEYGYVFDSVSTDARTQVLDRAPIIDKEENMYGSIYEYVNLRKFTVFFYGGFDGWDVYRDQRTNTDKFKMSQYRGYINQNSGEGYAFSKIMNPELLQLNQNGITSDWYAYLSGIRQFATPEATDINVFATPGIDYVNQKLLVEEAIEMIEEERADSIYVITTPDKPSGADDFVDEMYTPEDAVYNLEDTEIDSNYSCTYYPWVKYLDVDNNQYIYLPPTKDAVRNFAQTDNTAWPWFAPAGIERGNVDCVRAHFITKLADEDVLYDGRINPVKTFAQDGPKIWGQKNLQINESQLNRIAVRRLLLRLRKLIAISCIGLIFEPNDATVKQSFISTVTPILDSIRGNRGISDYRIEVNDSIESRERRELPCKIYFKPYNALEYITIDFILSPEGVSFDDI